MDNRIEIMLIKGKDEALGIIGAANLKDLMINDLKKEYRVFENKNIDEDDLIFKTKVFHRSVEAYDYDIIESNSGKINSSSLLYLDPKSAQELVDFSKEVPGYSEGHLFDALEVFEEGFERKNVISLHW